MDKKQIDLLNDKIRGAETIAIMGHKNPDLDSLGSVLALAHMIWQNFGKKPVCMYDGNLPMYMDFLPGRDEIIYVEKLPNTFHCDLLICLDIANPDKQIGDSREKIFSRSDFVAKIDHHPNSALFGGINIDDPAAAAVAEIIYDIAQILGWKIDVVAANQLLAAIIGDTGNFRFTTNGQILRVAADLIDMGASVKELMQNLDTVPKKHILAQARIMTTAEFYKDMAIATISHENYKDLDGKADDVMYLLSKVVTVEYVIILTEAKTEQIHISFRSKTKPVDCIAANFAGGGHTFAAGGLFHGKLADAVDAVKKAILRGC